MKKRNDEIRSMVISIFKTVCFFFIGLIIVSGLLYALVGLYDVVTYFFFR